MAQIHSRHSTAGLEPDAHGACYAAWPHIEELQQQSRKRLFQDELARVGSPWLKWMIDASGGWKWLSGFQGAKYADSSGTKTRVAPRGGGIVPCRQPATAWKLSAKKTPAREETAFFNRFCCLRLLAVKQLRKNHLPAGKHNASEGRAGSKTTPKKTLTCRLKSWQTAFFDRFCCLRLLAVKQLRKNHLPAGKHNASEGRASSKTAPKNSLTCRLKS